MRSTWPAHPPRWRWSWNDPQRARSSGCCGPRPRNRTGPRTRGSPGCARSWRRRASGTRSASEGTAERAPRGIGQDRPVSRPSIVPIALTLDDRTGYTLWAPPGEEDGEEWQAFLGSTVDLPADINDDDPEPPGPTAVVHLFPSPAALAAFCRVNTDHDLADHPVWPVVAELGPADLTPDEDHRFDLDGVYDVVAENPDRWAVDELAATLDIVGRLAECCDTPADDEDDEDDDETAFENVAELVSRPEVAALRLGIDAFLGRDGEEIWVRLGTAVDELWEDVLEELDDHLDWTGAGTVAADAYPSAAEEAEARAAEPDDVEDELDEDLADDDV